MFEQISEAVGTGLVPEGEGPSQTVSSYEAKPVAKAEEFAGQGSVEDSQLEDDYAFARKNLQDIVESGQAALQAAVEVAAATGNPEIFSSVATLMGATSDAAKKLLEAQSQIKKTKALDAKINGAKGGQIDSSQITNIQQNIFVGTTKDMIKRLREIRDTEVIDAEVVRDERVQGS